MRLGGGARVEKEILRCARMTSGWWMVGRGWDKTQRYIEDKKTSPVRDRLFFGVEEFYG